jgi:23S rRNA (pseudouridine1915-N3)-methyltransferase
MRARRGQVSSSFYATTMMMTMTTLLLVILLSTVSPTMAFAPTKKRVVSRRTKFKPGSWSLYMGMKINIRIVGRKSGSEKWIDDAYDMYDKRLRPSSLEVETTWHKDNDALVKGVEGDKTKGHSVVLLDPLGKTRTSEELADDLYKWLDQGGSRLSLVIGGAEGLPNDLKQQNSNHLSLSSLTFTHQFARVLLIEQIYRASEIKKGSGYHK